MEVFVVLGGVYNAYFGFGKITVCFCFRASLWVHVAKVR